MALTATVTKPLASARASRMWLGRTVIGVRPTPGSWLAGLAVGHAIAMLRIPLDRPAMR